MQDTDANSRKCSSILLKNKRGVSPLIATVLLIAFAVALGAVVMNWGKTYVQDQADKASTKSDTEIACSFDVSLKWYERNGVKQVCYGDTFIFFMIENGPSKDLTGLKMVVDGELNVYINNSIYNETLTKADIKRINVSYVNASYGAIQQLNIIPRIDVGGVDVICSGRTLTKVNPTTCPL